MLTVDLVYRMCNMYQWFTHGTVEQYDRMFEMVKQGKKVHEIALVIWICSDPSITVETIEGTLKKAIEQDKLRRLNDRLNGY